MGAAVCQAVAESAATATRWHLAGTDKGTPQGSAVSPVLANLFLHYAFDMFLEREFPTVEFERYADDAVVHCVTERQARQVREANGVALRLDVVSTVCGS